MSMSSVFSGWSDISKNHETSPNCGAKSNSKGISSSLLKEYSRFSMNQACQDHLFTENNYYHTSYNTNNITHSSQC